MYEANLEAVRLAVASGAGPNDVIATAEAIRTFLEEAKSRHPDSSATSLQEGTPHKS